MVKESRPTLEAKTGSN